MKRMKILKVLALIVFVLPFAFILSACGDNDNLKTFENITFANQTIDYDGQEHEIVLDGELPQGVNVVYENNKGTNAGVYNAKATLTLEGYKTLELTAKLTINKLNYDMSTVHWNYESEFVYNGSEQSVEVLGLPQGVTVKQYQNNAKTNAGNYTASVKFNYDTINHNEPTLANLNWTINKADMAGITFESRNYEYDTQKHSLECVGNIPANSTVKVTYNDVEVDGVSEVGTYTVKLVITNANYNTYEDTATLKITSTEELLYSVVFNNKLYFQNNLDNNKLYVYDGTNVKKVNNDKAEYFTINGNQVYYYSSSLFSKVIKSFNGTTASVLLDVNGEYLACDGTYLYYAINNLVLNTDQNGIYKIKLDGSEDAIRLVQDKAEYLTYYDNNIYYSNVSDGRKLYSISVNSNNQETGTLLYDEKVSDILIDNGIIYFNSTKTELGLPVASAIRKYVISSGDCIKLTTDNGKYLTKIGSYIYYINKDKITSELFGDGIYRISVLRDSDNSLPGYKIISAEDNGFSSLASSGNYLYYYKLNDKHIYSYNLNTNTETDIMANFELPEETITPTGYAKLAEYNGEIYYTNPLDNGCLYKYNLTTKARYKVLADSVSNVYFYNGYMYYSTYISVNYALWRMDLQTNETTKISKSRCDNLIFDNDKIYYIKVGSAYNNDIVRMDLDGSNVETIYNDKNLWVASFEKADNFLYFTINPSLGNKYAYRYDLSTSQVENLNLRAKVITQNNSILYYGNIDDNKLYAYNLSTSDSQVLAQNVDINNMVYCNGYLYYSSTKSSTKGFYKLNISTGTSTKLSENCADGLIAVNNKIYFIQTAISYTNDYPSQSKGNGKLYCYDGNNIVEL
ncbi:MAG: DUF5050 domain-containing protein [Christensenellales bacterium]